MGNNSTRESRSPDLPPSSSRLPNSAINGPASPTDRHAHHPYTGRGTRGSRGDLSSLLGIGSSSSDVPERRETKQEREARKLEKERLARIRERERSIKEEHADGGYLVTMGVYTGHEDFNKGIVRQLMIERRIAPFWRGLDDFREDWTEYQILAAAKGLPIPAADDIPPQDNLTRNISTDSPDALNHSIQSLMVPITDRPSSVLSDTSSTLSPSHPAFSLPSPTSLVPPSSINSSSPFRPRSKTLASLTTSSRNPASTEMTPREIQLPNEPFVNGQRLEVFLYKDSIECPICFMYYPSYLNKTRCCGQPICSECFVQIKRPDPHPPEHEHNDPSNPTPPPVEPAAEADSLVSEPSTCPYCQVPEFGVTYDAPPFRRGLSYSLTSQGITSLSSAMSSSSSLNSETTMMSHPNVHKRRTTSISANAPTVITTDKIRPDWSTKLSTARSHLARRSAAATALHTAAYLMGNNNSDSRGVGFSFGGRSRFGRHRGEGSAGTGGTVTSSVPNSERIEYPRTENQESGNSRRRSRMDDLEDMMIMEAIRLSLAAEEERKKKADKETAKEAKKKAKEEKKREKKERKVYGSGMSSASGSALSLTLPGLGRRRGNSGASNLAREVTPEEVQPSDLKGKGIDRGSQNSGSAPMDIQRGESSGYGFPGSRHLDIGVVASINDSHLPSPSPTAPDKPSHLRQMSNVSSGASSFAESTPGSEFHPHGSSSTLESPNASGTNVAEHPGGDESIGNAAAEPMFNFQSLAAMIGDDDDAEDKQDAAKHIEYLNVGESSAAKFQDQQSITGLEESVVTIKANTFPSEGVTEGTMHTTLLEPQHTTPEVMLTPDTPAANTDREQEGKQLGSGWSEEVSREITQ